MVRAESRVSAAVCGCWWGDVAVAEGKSNKMKLHRKYREEKLVRQHHKKLKKALRSPSRLQLLTPAAGGPQGAAGWG